IFWPTDLTIIYPRWQISESVWWQYLYPIAALALLVGLWSHAENPAVRLRRCFVLLQCFFRCSDFSIFLISCPARRQAISSQYSGQITFISRRHRRDHPHRLRGGLVLGANADAASPALLHRRCSSVRTARQSDL